VREANGTILLGRGGPCETVADMGTLIDGHWGLWQHATKRDAHSHNLCTMEMVHMFSSTQNLPTFNSNVSFHVKKLYSKYISNLHMNVSGGLCVNQRNAKTIDQTL